MDIVGIIILFLATIVGYFVLQSHKGKRLEPASTPKGKRERVVLWSLAVIIVAAAALIVTHQSTSLSMAILPVIVGAAAVLSVNLKTKK